MSEPDSMSSAHIISSQWMERYKALECENARLRAAGDNLIADVRRRYPGEELRCQYMRALDDALRT